MVTALSYLLVAVVVAAALFGIAVVVFGRGEELPPLPPRATPTRLPEGDLDGGHVRELRFPQAVRGYRMDDVDWVLERLADELDRVGAERDGLAARIAELESGAARRPVNRCPPTGLGTHRPVGAGRRRLVSRTELVVPVDIDGPGGDRVAGGHRLAGPGRVDPGHPGDGATAPATAAGSAAGSSPFTGVGPVGFTDPMEVVEWDPPRRCVVAHLGRVVRGDGVFEVTELGPGPLPLPLDRAAGAAARAARPARLAAGPPGLPAGRGVLAAPAGAGSARPGTGPGGRGGRDDDG